MLPGAMMGRESSYGRPPPAGAIYLGSLDLARGVLLVDLAAGLAPGGVGVWEATGGRARAGRGADEPPPSKASDTSIAPFTSPKGPPPPALGLGATWIGLEFVLSCALFSKEGR